MTNETNNTRTHHTRQITTALVSAMVGGVVAIAFGAVTVSARLAVVEAKVEDLRTEIRELRIQRAIPPTVPLSPSITETFYVAGHLRQ